MIAPMSHAPVSLPLLATQRVCSIPANQPIRKSRMTVRRFTILVIVQLLMIVHVVQWLAVGVTLAPIEPSESMETIKHGAVTVGFIFFAVAILSTAILGRWFCGWGCHILMLQDFCGSLLHKSGIRPKAFRSRLLRWIPVALAAYMFVWPLVYRFAIAPILQPDLVPMALSWKMTTTDYWTTFPGLMMAIPFLLVCGFVTVWFLGQKGYCTYACPYGGVFAPVDELAIGRIRVSDACEGCGHCTAVCTSVCVPVFIFICLFVLLLLFFLFRFSCFSCYLLLCNFDHIIFISLISVAKSSFYFISITVCACTQLF